MKLIMTSTNDLFHIRHLLPHYHFTAYGGGGIYCCNGFIPTQMCLEWLINWIWDNQVSSTMSGDVRNE